MTNRMWTLGFAALALVLLLLPAVRPAAGQRAGRYEYKVIAVTAAKELRTQADAEQGRIVALEKTINELSSQGWEFVQADGYVLYFRK